MGVPDTRETREVRICLEDGIGAGWIKADGYCPKTKTIYEFWGDLWHGNLDRFEKNHKNPHNRLTMLELNKLTQFKRERILNAGYNLIEIWESDWRKRKDKQ